MKVLVTQLCPTLCDLMDCMQPTRFLCTWDAPGKNTGVGSHSLLQGMFPSQGSNPDLRHCRPILYLEAPGNFFNNQCCSESYHVHGFHLHVFFGKMLIQIFCPFLIGFLGVFSYNHNVFISSQFTYDDYSPIRFWEE